MLPSDILIVFESRFGQTSKIADYIATAMRTRGPSVVRVLHVGAVRASDVRAASAVVLLAPIYYSRVPPSVRSFVTEHDDDLTRCSVGALFTVSGKAASTVAADRDEAVSITHRFVARHRWRPQLVATFGGAIAYPKYNFVFRLLSQAMAIANGGPTDATRIHELTSWSEVDGMIARLERLLEARKDR